MIARTHGGQLGLSLLAEDVHEHLNHVGVLERVERLGGHCQMLERLEHRRCELRVEHPERLDEPCTGISRIHGRERRTSHDRPRRHRDLDLAIRLRDEQEDVDKLGLGALCEIVVVRTDREERVRERIQHSLRDKESAEVVPGRGTLRQREHGRGLRG